MLADAAAGADRHCRYCETLNDGRATVCKQCGASMDESVPYAELAKPAKVAATEVSPADRLRLTKSVGVTLGVLVAVLLGLWSFWPVSRGMTVTGHEWARAIEIEQLDTYHETDWTVPAAGRQTGQFKAVHHHEQVLDHYETSDEEYEVQTGTRRVKTGTKSLGNGYFEDEYEGVPVYETRTRQVRSPVYRDEPVYRTKYRYDIERWKYHATIPASGMGKNPYWPKVQLQQGMPPYCAGEQRERSRSERYAVHLVDKSQRKYTMAVKRPIWETLQPSQTVVVEMSRLGVLYDIKTLEK
jgi:hypothetical protein